MPRSDEPRIPVRFSRSQYEMIKLAAENANVAMGALLRECAVRYAATVAEDVRRGTTTSLRRAHAVEAVKGQVAPASTFIRSPAEEWAKEKQRRLNADSERARAKR